MLITNVMDYLVDNDGYMIEGAKFHIPNHKLYKEMRLPYAFNEDGVLVDNEGNLAVMTVDLLHNCDWEPLIEEPLEENNG